MRLVERCGRNAYVYVPGTLSDVVAHIGPRGIVGKEAAGAG